jgi:hypothetical protein
MCPKSTANEDEYFARLECERRRDAARIRVVDLVPEEGLCLDQGGIKSLEEGGTSGAFPELQNRDQP